ncbi:UDP-glycosyltransferase 74E1-like [Neltuma alba]|uniref:UDP-glycosyltransferase 74E1-like n=1 Tax=Neltuma alba TaxID=207710 RepID=UPI0010A3D105|nr:UDP-glycosyltransferase 74E1-like [Prosopis alba]
MVSNKPCGSVVYVSSESLVALDIDQNSLGLEGWWNLLLMVVESLGLGVPMLAVTQGTDQPTDAKCIKDVWKIGVKAEADEKRVVRRETGKKLNV